MQFLHDLVDQLRDTEKSLRLRIEGFDDTAAETLREMSAETTQLKKKLAAQEKNSLKQKKRLQEKEKVCASKMKEVCLFLC